MYNLCSVRCRRRARCPMFVINAPVRRAPPAICRRRYYAPAVRLRLDQLPSSRCRYKKLRPRHPRPPAPTDGPDNLPPFRSSEFLWLGL
ncbi:hypothetical protein EVAR_34008_1 [Eumeta japonica]|uniref:Uncharacterized protein n=1 Tax=Eumeta variegata TaxID=151549 RepID=A0A4C1VR16_EUMVA|nr:hypothetical protein EVAR_34008_1 [Eumeta japonica]